MTTPISITLEGGNQAGRNLVAHAIETGLTGMALQVENNVVNTTVGDEAVETSLLDYARNSNPNLFTQAIEINQVIDEEEVIEDPVDEEELETIED